MTYHYRVCQHKNILYTLRANKISKKIIVPRPRNITYMHIPDNILKLYENSKVISSRPISVTTH